MAEEVTAGDALAVIAETEPSALKLVGDIMEFNARSLQRTFETMYEIEKREHEKTEERLRVALEHIDRVERRLAWLAGGPDDLLYEGGAE